MLSDLRAKGARLGLCTNKPQMATIGLLEALGLGDAFHAVIGGDALAGVRKPDPAHLAAVLDALSVPPSRAVMVGDSRNDLLAARGLGIRCVLVSFGYTAVPARELGADAVIDRLRAVAGRSAACHRRRPGPLSCRRSLAARPGPPLASSPYRAMASPGSPEPSRDGPDSTHRPRQSRARPRRCLGDADRSGHMAASTMWTGPDSVAPIDLELVVRTPVM